MSLRESIPYVTRIVEPRYNRSGFQSQFELPDNSAFYSDLRLAGVGFSSASGTTSYNGLLGAEAPIQKMSLLDGGTVIEQVDFQNWRPMQKVNTDNDSNISMQRYLSHNSLGFIAEGRVDLRGQGNYGGDQQTDVALAPVDSVNTTDATSQQAWISLKEVFGFLRSMSIVPTNVFKQMRVVIEYSTSTKLVADNTKTDLQTTPPVLFADELLASDVKRTAMSTFQGIRYTAVEHDSFLLPVIDGMTDVAGNRTIERTVTTQLKAFNGKYIRDLILKFSPTNAQTTGGGANKLYGQLGSQATYGRNIQVRVNGVDTLPQGGARGSMRQLAMTTDTMGTLNLLWSQYTIGPQDTNELGASLGETIAEMSPFACDVESSIEDLQLIITRSGVFGNPDLNDPIRVDCFARIPKSIVVTRDGRYAVLYDQSEF